MREKRRRENDESIDRERERDDASDRKCQTNIKIVEKKTSIADTCNAIVSSFIVPYI